MINTNHDEKKAIAAGWKRCEGLTDCWWTPNGLNVWLGQGFEAAQREIGDILGR